ncbi:MAG: murein biosynthesis integral membrane protein MurJ [Anaerolineae bacterium]|nr:murein biosynthesis integral membrane protein MurJ [Anaerolineae bacterium]
MSEVIESQQVTETRFAKATGVLALGNITSRVLGLLREVVITNLFGASGVASALRVAILIPKSAYDLLIAGHVNGAIIPVLSEIFAKQGKAEFWRLVSALLNMVVIGMSVLVIGLQFGAPLAVDIFGGGYSPEIQAIAVDLLRITSPTLIFMAIFAILSGALYALHVFTYPAFATTVFNASIVLIALIFTPPPALTMQWVDNAPQWVMARPDSGISMIAIGWLIGGIAQMALQIPGLWGNQARYRFILRHPALKKIGWLYLPVMFSLIMDTLVIRPFSYNLASRTGDSSINYMELATTLMQFPQGLVATAISIAILPTLSRQAALIVNKKNVADENNRAFVNSLGLGLRLTFALIIPAAIGLFVLGTPIIALLFEHGAFRPADTEMTSVVLHVYLIGLPFAAVDLLLVYAFYARQDTLTPALIGLFCLVVYMIISMVLVDRFGLLSLMIADSAKHILHAGISAILLFPKLGGVGGQRLGITFIKTLIAAGGMGIIGAVSLPMLTAWIGADGFIREGLLLMASGGLSVGVFLMLAWMLKLEELRWLVQKIRGRG